MPSIRTVYGSISAPDWPDDLIIKTLRTYGEWAFCEQLLLSSLIRGTDVVWDVGAFLGTFGVGVAQLARNAPHRILAIDPNPALLEHISLNLRQNAPCEFDIACVGVSDHNGWLVPDTAGDGNAGSLAYANAEDHSPPNAVPCRTLADLRAEYGNYDILKLDVEGMEVDALRGDLDYLRESKPVIWAECNEGIESIRLLEALNFLDYDPLYVAFPSFRSMNFNLSTEVFFPMAYEAVLLAGPRERLESFTGEIEGEDIIVKRVRDSFDLRKALWFTPRWAMNEWVDLTRPELVALLGRNARGEGLVDFLNDAATDVAAARSASQKNAKTLRKERG